MNELLHRTSNRHSLVNTLRVPHGLNLLLIVLVALATQAASLTASYTTAKTFVFELGAAYGDKDKFDLPPVSEAGCILAYVTAWSTASKGGAAASELALILNGSAKTGYYARTDGKAPLWFSYAVSAKEAKQVKTWTISVANFTKGGSARGTLAVEYPPTQVPCQFRVAVSRTKGQVEISWRYTSKPFSGMFLVERSIDGKTWGVLSACSKSPVGENFYCTDKGLTSGKTYYYHACAVASGVKRCGSVKVTPALAVKAT